MKIIGIEEKQGTYEGNTYYNILFHCTEVFGTEKGIGAKVKSVKVKHKVLSENFGKPLTEKELGAFIGKEAIFFYDEYQSVKFVQIQQDK